MRSNLFTRLAPFAAVAAFAATASAQQVVTNGVSVAGERRDPAAAAAAGGERAALFTQAAYTAPKGAMGVGVQAYGTRSSIDDVSATASALALSGFYGVTDRVSIGAYVPYARVSFDDGVTDGSESGLGDAGIFARFAAMQSGATRFALGAEVSLPTGDDTFGAEDPSYGINAALSHVAGKWNLHASPSAQFVSDFDPSINLDVAAVRAMSERLSWSSELLTQFGGALSDSDQDGAQDIDLASGLRYRFSRTVMDFGLRYNLSSNLDPKPTTFGAYVGFNWAF